jgi:nucleotide-binding universal stress UspA family protein
MSESSTQDRTVTVGVDGSAGSASALRWAVDHADQLGAIVPVMTFVTGPFVYGFGEVDGPDRDAEPYRSDAILHLERFLREHVPALVGRGAVTESRAGPGLVHLAEGSELLVVGTRGWSARSGLALGSVGAYCARHSTVPVALIPHGEQPVHEHLDVVVVVHAYESVIGEPLSLSPEHAEAGAREVLEAGVRAARRDLDGHPPVEMVVMRGDPRVALRTASGAADLLVVGSRGQGVLDRLLLGSVANALVDHPTVPTIVVPGRQLPTTAQPR